jgi:hypothetical protein
MDSLSRLRYTNQDSKIEFKVDSYYISRASESRGLYMDYDCDFSSNYVTNQDALGYKIAQYCSGINFLWVSITKFDDFHLDILNTTPTSDNQKVTSNNYFMEKIPSTLRNLLFLKHSNRTTMLLF